MYFIKLAEMSKKKDLKHDIGWKHGKMLSARHHWRCKWYNTEFKGGGVIRLKQYLAGGYDDVFMCQKYPQEVCQLMKKHFIDFKASKERAKQKRVEMDRRATEPPFYTLESQRRFSLQMMRRYRLRLPCR